MGDAQAAPTPPGPLARARANEDATTRAAGHAAWTTAHAVALRAQDDWMDRHGHPFLNVFDGPFAP